MINLDESGTNTDAVTSGSDGQLKTFVIHRAFDNIAAKFGEDIDQLIQAVKEIEQMLNYQFLDIEFAISDTQDIFIFKLEPYPRHRCKWQHLSLK